MEATYLGNEINNATHIKHEMFNKMQEVRKTWFKFLPYWEATNAKVKWQLLIFDAVVRSKLLYGLETIQLTGAMLKKIDAFQIRCLRRILRIPSTFIDRRSPNRVVFQRCTEILHQNQGEQRELEFFSRSYHRKKSKLLGHVLRSRDEDLMRHISFQLSNAIRVHYGKKRIVRTRQNWPYYDQQHVFEHFLRGYKHNETVVEDMRIYNATITRTFKAAPRNWGYAHALCWPWLFSLQGMVGKKKWYMLS